MKHVIILISLIILPCRALFPQNIEKIIAEVEENNTTLIALRKNADAERIGNKTGLFPGNPEFEFNYLWGSPEDIGKRNDVSLMQSFDFPSAYAYRNQISEYRNIQVELEFERQRREILLHARQVCNGLVYHNALKAEFDKRIENARMLADSYKSKYELGETNIIDFNKARVNLLNIVKDAESNEIEIKSLLADLMNLNGGKTVEFTDSIFPLNALEVDFEQWYLKVEKNNPVLQWLRQEVTINRKNEKLNQALGLPKLQAGYMSEKVVGEQYQGISVGIAIPLLENRNAVKYAKAKTVAVQSAENDARVQFYNNLKALHARAISLKDNLNDYRENLGLFNNTGLVRKALDEGEISLAEYLFELTFYYESIDKMLAMERDYNETVIELNKYR